MQTPQANWESMSPIKLTALTRYNGSDPGYQDQPVEAEPGETVEVSPRKLLQLRADFPEKFDFDTEEVRQILNHYQEIRDRFALETIEAYAAASSSPTDRKQYLSQEFKTLRQLKLTFRQKVTQITAGLKNIQSDPVWCYPILSENKIEKTLQVIEELYSES